MQRRSERRIVAVASFVSLALCTLMGFQLGGIVPPLGISWGDDHGLHGGRACSLGFDGEIMFETLAGVKRMPPGVIIGARERSGARLVWVSGKPTWSRRKRMRRKGA